MEFSIVGPRGSQHTFRDRRGYFSEYRYDALGHRVLVRTRRDGLCNTSQSTVDCTSGIERFVWAGDNIIWELRSTETARPAGAGIRRGQEYGIVGYTHAGGVDPAAGGVQDHGRQRRRRGGAAHEVAWPVNIGTNAAGHEAPRR